MTWRSEVRTSELARTAAWDGARPEASVVVATCDRGGWLPGLLGCLEAQQDVALEVVLVDDSSRDGTSEVLASLGSALPVLALRTDHRAGPSAARNAGAAAARGAALLLTDDDCLPDPGWARGLLRELAAGATVVQGRTLPTDDDHGPWDRSITVTAPTGLYETCNLAVVADAFRAVGGFGDLGLLAGPSARGFGEDAELGSLLASRGRPGWAPEAVVRHRWVAGSYADHLAARRRLVGFPALAGLVPEVRERLVGGVLLSRRTLVTDAGVLAVAAAVLARSPWPALGCLPWAGRLAAEAAGRPGRPRLVRAAQGAAADLVGAAALARGSLRARRPVL